MNTKLERKFQFQKSLALSIVSLKSVLRKRCVVHASISNSMQSKVETMGLARQNVKVTRFREILSSKPSRMGHDALIETSSLLLRITKAAEIQVSTKLRQTLAFVAQLDLPSYSHVSGT